MKTLFLIGAADSIGVPYTRDNVEHVGFFELFAKYLSREHEVIEANCFYMSTNNDNKYIAKLLSSDATVVDAKASQNEMLLRCKSSGIYPYVELPKSFLNHYRVYEGDEQIIIRDAIQENDTIFLYSAFVNDLLKSKELSLFKLLRPGRIQTALSNLNVDQVFREMEKNLEHLIKLNPKIKIFLIGWFVPTKISYVRKNLRDFVVKINNDFAKFAEKYSNNVFYVDNLNLSSEDFNNIDFHPNKSGHEKIYQNLLEAYKKMLK